MGYIFDVDGVLTESSQRINERFRRWFYNWSLNREVYIVSGSNSAKIISQLGAEILDAVKIVFYCSGNVAYIGDELMYKNVWTPTSHQLAFLQEFLNTSEFKTRTGGHIVQRHGAINFSVVGRNAARAQRAEYVEWDNRTGEREHMAKLFRRAYPDMDAVVGGETGIDIFPKGKDKSQVVDTIGKDHTFFADQCQPGGNDYALAQKVHSVVEITHGWYQTYWHLQEEV